MTITTDSDCKLQSYLNKLTNANCLKTSKCNISIATADIFSQCPNLSTQKYIYLSYMCNDKIIELGSILMDRNILSYLLVGIDTFSIVIIIITIIILRCDYSKLNKNFKLRNRLINQYTINVKNLEVDFEKIDLEINSLLEHLDNLIRSSMKIEFLTSRITKDKAKLEILDKNPYARIKIPKLNSNNSYNINNIQNNIDNIANYDNPDNNQESNPISQNASINDLQNEVKFPTFVYEVNYPYLSNTKLNLILKKEKLVNDLIIKNSRIKLLQRQKNFGEYNKISNNEKHENKLNNNNINENDLFADLNLDNLGDFNNNILDLNNNNNNNNEINFDVNIKVNPYADDVNNNENQVINKEQNEAKKKPEPSRLERFEYNLLNTDMKKLKIQILKIINQIKTHENTSSGKINDILITFLETKYSKFIFNSYNKSKCTRCCYIFCCKYDKIKRFYFKNSWLEIQKNPDNPSNIKWQNMLVSPCNKCCSKSFSIILSFLLILIGFGIIVGSKYFQDVLNTEFNNEVNCNFVSYTDTSVIQEYFTNDIPKRNRIQTFCFCQNGLTKNGLSYVYDYKFPTIANIPNVNITTPVYPCRDWTTAYIKFNAITYSITILIPILNSIITFVLMKLTHIEKNKSRTSDKSSNMIKIFIGQFINAGLNLLMVNAYVPAIRNWNANFPIFNGIYSDFTTSWFKNVGCTIFFTLIISIFTPHLGILIGSFLTCLKRCCDSCNMKGKGSKITDSKSFMKLYVGPEMDIDSRYAQVRKNNYNLSKCNFH